MKKIVIIGPESTGKSTLSRQLALHYKCLWVPEFAREFLEANGSDYSYEDLLTIAKGQIESEDQYIRWTNEQSAIADRKLIIDTDMYVMKVWCEYVFGKCYQRIIDRVVQRDYDLYLLCNTDLPWVPDELREYPDPSIRQLLFNSYKDILINQQVPWAMISGTADERFSLAVSEIDRILQ